MFYCFEKSFHNLSGHGVEWENRLECEVDAKKRAWLLEFSRPTVLLSDVCDMASDDGVLNHATGEVKSVPRKLFIFCFGFSCKDLSTLNNHAGGLQGLVHQHRRGHDRAHLARKRRCSTGPAPADRAH